MWDAYQKESVENGGAISRKPLGPTDPRNMESSNNHRSDLGPGRDVTATNTYDGTAFGSAVNTTTIIGQHPDTIGEHTNDEFHNERVEILLELEKHKDKKHPPAELEEKIQNL